MEPAHGDETAVSPAETPLVTRSRELAGVAPVAVLRAVDRPTVAWAEGERTVVAGGAAATISAACRSRFDDVRRAASALFADRVVDAAVPRAARPRLFGGFAFHEGSTGTGDDPWTGFPAAQFVLPAVQVVVDGTTRLVATAAGERAVEDRLDEWERLLDGLGDDAGATRPRPGIESRTYTPEEAGWHEQVTAAVDRIERGDLRKVVLAQAQTVELANELSIPDAFGRLGETYPDCYRFVVAPESDGAFFGATPELLVSRTGRTVRTTALAGSTGRGDTAAEDEWLARQLRDSQKDGHEHQLVVEAIKGQLAPFATSISTGDRTVRKLASVQHLRTPVTAELAEDDHVLGLVEALHPTPAVGGLPPDEAWETIRETEAFDRGWYAAPVGWFDAEGNGTFAVAIRSAVARCRRATLFAGNGIVADSDPDREWDEVQLKYHPILDTLE